MVEDISGIIREKDFSKLIGLKESLWFEAKGKDPYQLGSARGRYELVKDVSAFANAEGGHIVIGLSHKQLENEMTEEVSAIELITEAEFDIKKYGGLIKDYIYPQIDGIAIAWEESSSEKGKGVGVIFVPVQKETKKHFLITRGIILEGDELKDNVVGIARRQGARNMPIPGKDIYGFMQRGKSDIAQRLSGIEDALSTLQQNMIAMFHAIASVQEERRIAERQVSFDKLYDAIKKVTE
jgi:predicted HTH transcriptional regulator